MNKPAAATSQNSVPAFAAPAALPKEEGKAVTSDAIVPPTAVETSVGTTIGALSELNNVAAKTDAVFIFLPGKDSATGVPPSAQMKEAVQVIEANAGKKCELFTLKPGAPEYDQIAGQMKMPGVLAMVKGGGMVPISGDITQAKLVQAFVAASSAGGCGSGGGGCGPSGCK